MKIKPIEPMAVALPMKKPVFMAGVEIRQADNVLVRIESDTGVVGWGEAASAPTMTGETVESMMAAVAYLMPAVQGRDPEDIAGASVAMDGRMYGNHAAKAAIEIALHDLVGRATGRPVHALLGGKKRSRMPVLGVISNGEIAADLREAAENAPTASSPSRSRSASTSRWSMPSAPGASARRSAAACLISADANQGWSTEEAVQYVRAVAGSGLDFFEQPVVADDLAGMAAVAAASRVPIGADEGIHSLDDIRRHHERKAARGVSLKTIKLGGMRGVMAAGRLCDGARPQRQRLLQDRRIEHRLRGRAAPRGSAAAARLGPDPVERRPDRGCDRAPHSHRARACGSIRPSRPGHRCRRGPRAALSPRGIRRRKVA